MSSASPTVRVIYFASVRTTLGLSHESIALPSVPTSLPTLIELIAQRHNDKQPDSVLAGCRWSVDNTLIEIDEIANWTLSGGEEVAAIPPVSGG
ncbi:related to Molybdopterin synthase small subunit [Moesziomyces antarcticus]|uniref:Related to Molybdopterin synthase small subunit n=1 Tax=Pseudozyma antarctica TaxID=84753 RepID=A0A5C3FV20_PSEA2|nr:related to Molybdopterin synthase small subunit [Moesziomyces antarcticus]